MGGARPPAPRAAKQGEKCGRESEERRKALSCAHWSARRCAQTRGTDVTCRRNRGSELTSRESLGHERKVYMSMRKRGKCACSSLLASCACEVAHRFQLRSSRGRWGRAGQAHHMSHSNQRWSRCMLSTPSPAAQACARVYLPPMRRMHTASPTLAQSSSVAPIGHEGLSDGEMVGVGTICAVL